ncbi:lipid binding hydrolase [Escherichia coli O145:H28]|nr:lipid binding hydrolase [Escherichia coli O145:H28]
MKIRLLILSLLVSVPAFAWQPQTGDIIFQISRSSQSKAIQLATHSDYSHTGMLVMRNKKPYVFEAVGPVKYTPLKQWIAHGEKGKYVVRRVEGGLNTEQQQKLAQTAKRYLGKPYDFSFSWSDDRQYCSEVVWKVYQNALGMRVGEQQKLKEFDLSNPLVQAKLKERYGKIFRLRKRWSHHKPFSIRHNSPRLPKNGRCFRGDTTKIQAQKKRRAALFSEIRSYLLPGMLKRLLKRSTRPPVATSRCLPVKNGWHLLHTSRFRS